MEQHHEGSFREKLARANAHFREQACRETSKEVFRERALDYEKETKAERFEGPSDAPCCDDPVVKTRIDEITKTIHRVEIKEEPSCPVHEGSGLHKKRWVVFVCSFLAAIAIAAAGLGMHYQHKLELARMRQLERVGSHAQCHEEKLALEARLAVLEANLAAAANARLTAEREAGMQAGLAMRLQAELAESRAELIRARADAAAAIQALQAAERTWQAEKRELAAEE